MPNEIEEVFVYLRLKGAARAIEYYKNVFGAVENMRLDDPDGRVGHAQMMFGKTCIMLSDEYPERGIVGPQTAGGVGTTIHIHVGNADEFIQRAVAAGATLASPATDHFWGERSGRIVDPFGHIWIIGHDIEAVSPEEMQRRFTERK